MVQIVINKQPVQLLGPLPDKIEALTIVYHYGMMIDKSSVLHIKKWLNDLVDRITCEHILVNGVITNKKDINKFKL